MLSEVPLFLCVTVNDIVGNCSYFVFIMSTFAFSCQVFFNKRKKFKTYWIIKKLFIYIRVPGGHYNLWRGVWFKGTFFQTEVLTDFFKGSNEMHIDIFVDTQTYHEQRTHLPRIHDRCSLFTYPRVSYILGY